MKIRIITMMAFIITIFTSCEKNFVPARIPDPVFKGTMWEYFKSIPKTWELTCQLITRAGLVDLIDGKDPEYPQITFFAPTEITLFIYLYEHSYESIEDIPVDECKQIVLSYIIPERKLRKECDFEIKGTLEGGTEINTLTDLKLRIYQVRGTFNGIEDIGPTSLWIHFKDLGFIYNLSDTDHLTDNGVVHTLNTDAKFENPLK